MLQKKFIPQVDSTNKFSKDLSGEHEHGPGSQVYPNDNTHSAWTQHILKDIFAKILFFKKQLLFWTKYYENVKSTLVMRVMQRGRAVLITKV